MNRHEIPHSASVEQLARRVFTELHQTIIFHESGAMSGNVDSVHDMRVTVRRLRVALSNFAVCISREDRKRLKSSLENLADALGGVRDMDVMIAAIKALSPAVPSQDKAAISSLIGRLRARRRARLRALIGYLGGDEYAAFKRESPADWISRDAKASVSAISYPGSSQTFSEEQHGQAA